MKLFRVFCPVGQGAFYVEVFVGEDNKRFVVVYDCGSETASKDMEMDLDRQIDRFASYTSQIDILFISHFHADHISGLDRLLGKVKVIRTVIPMLDVPTITVTRVQNFIRYNQSLAQEADDTIRELYLDGGRSERFGEIVVVAPETEAEYGNDNDREFALIKNGKLMFSGSSISDHSIWEYIPFNSLDRSDLRTKKLYESLKKLAAGPLDLNILIRDHLADVKEAYRRVMNYGNDNLYTLVVISKPVRGIVPQPSPRLAHCVYFGDFDFDQKNKPWERFKRIIEYAEIGTVQVPHHGAKGNWYHEMGVGDPRHYIVSVGTSNRYHHPNYWVMQDIWDGGHRPFVICEKYSSLRMYEFEI